MDRLGIEGVRALLGAGRKDESGDFTTGADLSGFAIEAIVKFATAPVQDTTPEGLLNWWNDLNPDSNRAGEAISVESTLLETSKILQITRENGYSDRIGLDTAIVRGLDYYTGPVFEAQLSIPISNEDGETVVFGSVAGGGRYDDLVSRFTGQQVPATGISIGVSRLMSALKGRQKSALAPLVVVLALEDSQSSFRIAAELRRAGVRAESYVGTRKFGDQLKYADRRGAAIAVIEGSDERAKGEVTLKDLALGAALAKSVESRGEWVKDRPAQISIPRAKLVEEIRMMLGGN
jgi:histidyl-tRNA synthetase